MGRCWTCGKDGADFDDMVEADGKMIWVKTHRACHDAKVAENHREAAELMRSGRYTKVHFPEGETMWVEIVDGDDNEGRGILRNQPAIAKGIRNGDEIVYGGGTKGRWAEFVCKA